MTHTGRDDPTAGDLLAGRYRVRSRLGAGAMGVVWLALDERLERLVAVKQLWPGPAESEESRQRVMREGRIAARLRHPHAVTVHDMAEHHGQPVLVMEYVPSRSLAAVLAEQGPLTPERVARIGAAAASALAAAHAAGIVHRDVKPGNLLVGDDGTVKIADFGISHAAGDVSVTRVGVVAGTPAYLAPEVARGGQPTPDSDMFSLGSTLYAAVEGTPPFGEDADNAITVLHRVAAARIPPPHRAGPLTPALLAMLDPDPTQRPTATQVADALERIADGQPIAPAALNPAADQTRPVITPSASTVPVTPIQGPGGTRLDAQPVDHPTRSSGRSWLVPRRLLFPVLGTLIAALSVGILLTAVSPPATTPAPSPAPSAPATPSSSETTTPPPPTTSQQERKGPGQPDKKGDPGPKGEPGKKIGDNGPPGPGRP